MEYLLTQLESDFKTYIEKVDNHYNESTKKYSSLWNLQNDGVNNTNQDNLVFYSAISHIIRQFLEADGNDNSLFIQVPVDEIAVKPKDQKPNYYKMEEAIAHTLSMAVCPISINAPKIENAPEGSFYYTADEINGRPRLWQAKIARTTQRIYPDELFKDRGQFGEKVLEKTEGLRNIFNDHLNNTYKLSSLPENFNRPTQEKMAKMAKLLAIYKANKTNKQYNNALMIGYGSPKNLICNYPYVEFPLEFTNKYNNVDDKEYDIVICVGDRYYLGNEMQLNQRLAQGKSKKIIYIGTTRPQDFNGETFSFSYREMYHYFAQNKFPTFKIHNWEWRELSELLENTSKIFSNDRLNIITDIDKIKRHVNSHIIYQYIGKDSNNESEEESFQDDILDFINTNYSYLIDNDQWDFLKESFEKLSLPKSSNNPKTDWFKDTKKNNPNSQYLYLNPSQPYKDKIKETCKKNNLGNTFAIDVHVDSYQYIDTIKALFERLALGTFNMVSFFKLKRIFDFLLKETEMYKQEYRKKILGNITYTESQTSRQEYGSLDNFDYDLEALNDWMKTSATTTNYVITDENDNTYDICGDVIRCKQLIDVDKLFEYKEDWLPCELSFYQKPENFHELRDVLYDLPVDRNIETYSNLWKERLKTRCHDKYQGDCNKMITEDKIEFSKGILKKVVKDKYTSKFPNCYYRLFNKMKDIGILTEEEHNYCIRAQKANENSRSVGRKLKEGTLNYVLTGECTTPDINIICSNSKKTKNPINLDSLKELCIKTVTIKEIKKSNKKHHDDE